MDNDFIELAHGDGGRSMDNFIEKFILTKFQKTNTPQGIGLKALDDGAAIKLSDGRFMVTSIDAHVINPIFFPGGDIGRLAVAGTVNDVAVMGAIPLAITDALIIEEGFPMGDLEKIVSSMNTMALEAAVSLIGGDTKVMPRGELDQIAIITSGLGISFTNKLILDSGANPGDKIICTGTIAEHELTILVTREKINVQSEIQSDITPLNHLMNQIYEKTGSIPITAAKDITRGGLAAITNEIASKSNVSLWINESEIPIQDSVFHLCEMLGVDPLNMANEGKILLTCHPEKAEEVLNVISNLEEGKNARIIGECRQTPTKSVILETKVGGKRILRRPVARSLPRIC
ncbi:MAG: hydrogenase expression/formation protein HypE [Promethearchaeota archaeon]